MSPSRLIAIGVSCLVGYVVGGYVGLYVILSSRGFDNPLETELLFATSPIQVGLIGMALSAAVAVTAGRAEGSVSIRGAG